MNFINAKWAISMSQKVFTFNKKTLRLTFSQKKLLAFNEKMSNNCKWNASNAVAQAVYFDVIAQLLTALLLSGRFWKYFS